MRQKSRWLKFVGGWRRGWKRCLSGRGRGIGGRWGDRRCLVRCSCATDQYTHVIQSCRLIKQRRNSRWTQHKSRQDPLPLLRLYMELVEESNGKTQHSQLSSTTQSHCNADPGIQVLTAILLALQQHVSRWAICICGKYSHDTPDDDKSDACVANISANTIWW